MNIGNNSQQQLRSIIDRIVNLEEQRQGLADDINDILTEAKSNGFDKGVLRAAVKIAMEDAEKREKRLTKEQILETYLNALGLLADTPLGQAAVERAVA